MRRILSPAQDLEQHGNSGRFKVDAIDEESRAGIILVFCVRVGIWELENDTHELNVQTDIDVGTAGCGIARLSHKVSKSDCAEKCFALALTTVEGASGYAQRRVSLVRRSSFEKLTWRSVSTSGFWLTGMFTIGSCCGLVSGAPA